MTNSTAARLAWGCCSLLLGLEACATPQAAERPASGQVFVHGQAVPLRALPSQPADFNAPDGVAVLHYYGAGGWGIQWGRTYLLMAPYFSNHNLPSLLAARFSGYVPLVPDAQAIREGFAGTPVASTSAVLIGHGHIDHTGDVAGFFGKGLIEGKPALIADRSTTNELAALASRFGCVASIDYWDPAASAGHCPIPGVRITPIHHAHAPHVNLVGLEVSAFGGIVKTPQETLPARADDFKLGRTWAYLIDLLDEQGRIVFRIHYVDAASGPPHGIIPEALVAERDVDLHIACVPGFEQSEEYPDAILNHLRVKYVLAGHWEDFFQPRDERLMPLRQVLDSSALDRFVNIVEREIPTNRGVAPINKSVADCAAPRQCGPHGTTWTLPVPGETFQFATNLTIVALPAR
jgi:hypothetical protein